MMPAPITEPAVLSVEAKQRMEKFTNYLYARCGLAESTIGLVTGYVRRMIPATGLTPSAEALEQYIADMRRRKVSYGNLTFCVNAF